MGLSFNDVGSVMVSKYGSASGTCCKYIAMGGASDAFCYRFPAVAVTGGNAVHGL